MYNAYRTGKISTGELGQIALKFLRHLETSVQFQMFHQGGFSSLLRWYRAIRPFCREEHREFDRIPASLYSVTSYSQG